MKALGQVAVMEVNGSRWLNTSMMTSDTHHPGVDVEMFLAFEAEQRVAQFLGAVRKDICL
jgi:hypothetical protein